MVENNRSYILEKMKGRMMSPMEFDFDRLTAPPLYSLLSVDDIAQLHKLATSIRYAARPIERMQAMDQILVRRGFRKFAGGTNRVVYKFLEDDRFLIKVATDAVGIGDSPKEFINQQYLKPFVTKVFEVSPCGTVGLFERVIPITSREEYLTIASDVYDMISNIFIGQYVCDDIGSEYFMNTGIRKGWGPVILDFSFMYFLDGNKLFCKNIMDDGSICDGVIDYDAGFNHLHCTRCGKRYKAMDLKKAIDENNIIREGGNSKMKVSYSYGDTKVIKNSEDYMDVAPKLVPRRKGAKVQVGDTLKVSMKKGGKTIVSSTKPEIEEETKSTLNARGTVVHAERKVSTVETTKEEPVAAPKEEEVVASIPVENGDEAIYIYARAEVINSSDLDGDEEVSRKGLIITDDNGNYIADPDGHYIFVDYVQNRELIDLAIVDKDNYESLIEKNAELQAALAESVKKIDSLMDRLKEQAEAEEEKPEEKEPWYLDSRGRKRDRVTKKYWKEPVETEEDEDIKFDTSSPFIKDNSDDESDDVQVGEEYKDMNVLDMMKAEIERTKDPDYVEDIPEDIRAEIEAERAKEAMEASLPVGAVPPTNKKARSARYSSEFYNNPNRGGKKKKK